LRARVLQLLVAPDAVVGLVEGAGEMRTGIRKAKAFAPTNVVQRVHGISRGALCLHGNEIEGIDTLGRLEEDTAAMVPASLVGVRRPGGEALGEGEVGP